MYSMIKFGLLASLLSVSSTHASWFTCSATGSNYTQECLDVTQPPGFVKAMDCAKNFGCNSCDYYTAMSIDATTRCCNLDDLSECTCPKKNTTSFVDAMFGPLTNGERSGGWCDEVSAACL